MNNQVEKVPVFRFTKEGTTSLEVEVAREFPVTIILNNVELVTMLCSPKDMKYLAAGFLSSEGLIKSKDEIKKILVDERRGVVRVDTVEDKALAEDFFSKRLITTGCGRGASFYNTADAAIKKIESTMVISPGEIFKLADEFQHGSEVYLSTHGVHSAALCDRKKILTFFEDVGRHNAIDKVFGKCLLEGIPTSDHLLMTSGRISSDSVSKAVQRSIPIIVSIAVPTDLSIRMANDFGITLVGHAASGRMNVYTCNQRIARDIKA
jgi:FdhD protein